MGQFRGCDTYRCAQSEARLLGILSISRIYGVVVSTLAQLSPPLSLNLFLGIDRAQLITWWGVDKLLTRLPVPQSGPQFRISAFRQDSFFNSKCAFPVRWRIYVSDYEHKMYSTTVILYKNQVMLFFCLRKHNDLSVLYNFICSQAFYVYSWFEISQVGTTTSSNSMTRMVFFLY